MDIATTHEMALFGKISSQNRALIRKFSEHENQSFEKNVTMDNIDLIQSWLGKKEENERILFWDRGGKYDDPEWKNLRAFDETSQLLFSEAEKHYKRLRNEAVEIQMKSDLALFSQFNTGLLFTGVAGAVRCRITGQEDRKGRFFKGVELRCVGSVEEQINSITIYPLSSEMFEVHFGTRANEKRQGIRVNSSDSFSLIQLARLVDKDLPKFGYKSQLKDMAGREVTLDTKSIRKRVRNGEDLGYDRELILHASTLVGSLKEAIESAKNLSRCFYERFGLETECFKIGQKYPNFNIMRDENFGRLLPTSITNTKGLVLYTGTLICRRCRREVKAFRDFSKSYPYVTFALVNLASPQSRFYERVFGDMAGGDPNLFRHNAVGATPFTILYIPDEEGKLHFAEYYASEKDELPPSFDETTSLFNRYFK